jgi:hypothetical protein
MILPSVNDRGRLCSADGFKIRAGFQIEGEFSSILASSVAFISVHLITLSALASTLGGIVRPIYFAALRLMINFSRGECGFLRSSILPPSFRFLPYWLSRVNPFLRNQQSYPCSFLRRVVTKIPVQIFNEFSGAVSKFYLADWLPSIFIGMSHCDQNSMSLVMFFHSSSLPTRRAKFLSEQPPSEHSSVIHQAKSVCSGTEGCIPAIA